MSEQDITPREQTKAELMRRNQRAFDDLQALINSLDDEQLSQPGSSGWAIKHHLGHLAVWQLGIVALLQGRSRLSAMGVGEAEGQEIDTDQMNDAIHRKYADLSSQQMKEKLQSAYDQMMAQIESMSNEDLFKPYKDFVPSGDDDRTDPVFFWIIGNGYSHYEEHMQWIQQILEEIE
jgi:hypothetical protein